MERGKDNDGLRTAGERVDWRELLDGLGDALVVVDGATGVVLDAAGDTSCLGCGPGELRGRSFDSLFTAKGGSRIRRALTRGGGLVRLDSEKARPAGLTQPPPLEIDVRPVFAGGEKYALACIRVISERLGEASARLFRTDAYHSIFINAQEALYQTSTGGYFIRANPAMAEMLGFASPEELMREVTNLKDQLYADHGERRRLLRELNEAGQVCRFETRFRTKGGETIWVSLSARKVYDDEGNLAYIEGSAVDVTTVRRAKDNLEREVGRRTAELTLANDLLTREIEEHRQTSRELRRAKEAAEEANRAKSDFLSMVSHELRTPLTAVRGFAQVTTGVLEKRIFPLLEESGRVARDTSTVRSNLSIILTESMRLTELINDLLDIAKLESGRMQLDLRETDLAEVINRAVESSGPLFEEKGLKVSVHADPGLPRVKADPSRLLQVFLNLFSNAAKFTEQGGVEVRAGCDNGSVAVSVKDTGIGIAPEHHHKVFEKFHQVEDAALGRPKGTGLGLAICREIVGALGGEMRLSSEPGRGSEFVLCIPAAP